MHMKIANTRKEKVRGNETQTSQKEQSQKALHTLEYKLDRVSRKNFKHLHPLHGFYKLWCLLLFRLWLTSVSKWLKTASWEKSCRLFMSSRCDSRNFKTGWRRSEVGFCRPFLTWMYTSTYMCAFVGTLRTPQKDLGICESFHCCF